MGEGRQSPPPERQTGAQLNDVPASGKGTDEAPDKQNKLQDQLKVHLTSLHDPHSIFTNALIELVIEPKGPYGRCRGEEVHQDTGAINRKGQLD